MTRKRQSVFDQLSNDLRSIRCCCRQAVMLVDQIAEYGALRFMATTDVVGIDTNRSTSPQPIGIESINNELSDLAMRTATTL